MNRQDWRPLRTRKWQDFMETGFQEFYVELDGRPTDQSHMLSSILLIASVAVICLSCVFV